MDFDTLSNFAFELFDEDGDGTIDYQELQSGLAYVHNTAKDDLPESVMELLDRLTFPLPSEVFKQYQKDYPALLLPAYKMQRMLRESAFSDLFWKDYTRKVLSASNTTNKTTRVDGRNSRQSGKVAYLAARRMNDEEHEKQHLEELEELERAGVPEVEATCKLLRRMVQEQQEQGRAVAAGAVPLESLLEDGEGEGGEEDSEAPTNASDGQ
jgi:hypothetical protein